MRSVLPALLLVAACAGPAPAPDDAPGEPSPASEAPAAVPLDPPFDAAAWIASVRAAETDAERKALSSLLLDAVDWRTACGEDDPTAPQRGLVQLHDVGTDRTLAEITCHAGASQSTFTLVDANAGRPPRLVRAFGIDEAGRPTPDSTTNFFGLLSVEGRPSSRFGITTKDAGHGGCGIHATYLLRPDGAATIVEVRAHDDCDRPLAPTEWPVTYQEDRP